ncbi:MAG: nicotinate phosphoribosyltransferase [Lentimonas sp.]|jgi:nicotinate phosphoribosyltransferase
MKTLLDNDLYKYTMMQAVWRQYPSAEVRYQFINRRTTDVFTAEAVDLIRQGVADLAACRLTEAELDFMAQLPFMQPDFIAFLRDFQLRAEDVQITFEEGQLALWVAGTWVNAILWEVPLMAIISQAYFEVVDTEWQQDLPAYQARTEVKGQRLTHGGCDFFEFGTRRRRSYATQNAVVAAFKAVGGTCGGTSNLHFAMKHGLNPIGTMAHEWIMGHAGLSNVADANVNALEAWLQVYQGQLDTALTDTYTTDFFLENIRGRLAREYDAMRHDSECPFEFADKILAFYQAEAIDPQTKGIVFSDSLNVDKVLKIEQHVASRTQTWYGIGTHFTNDFEGSHALNIVIKLYEVNGVKVAKLSDNPIKASGDPAAVQQSLAAIAERETFSL